MVHLHRSFPPRDDCLTKEGQAEKSVGEVTTARYCAVLLSRPKNAHQDLLYLLEA
jgi:hypothetical protein